MEKISSTFSSDHQHCDELFSRSEEQVQQHDWQQAKETFTKFVEEMEEHFSKEENVLFPALEDRTANAMGPTRVMRMEHEDMRQLIKDMQSDIEAQDVDHCLGLSETLLIMMQQHNTKEENILYPMADNVLADDQEGILTRARALEK
jgi:iron-sulfur cluster repair protein YtfE (RIC family)